MQTKQDLFLKEGRLFGPFKGRQGSRKTCHVTKSQPKPENRTRIRKEPDFDTLRLDDNYYKEIGMTKEEAEDELENLWNADPMNDPDIDNDSDDEDEAFGNVHLNDTEQSESKAFGPLAIIIAGFREHEIGMVRAILDEAGAYELKVLPCTSEMLHSTVSQALNTKEQDWDKPKPSRADMGNANWGSLRTVLFSGLGQGDVLFCLSLLETAGLPDLLVSVASIENSRQILGEVLAKTVQEHRKKKAVTNEPEIQFVKESDIKSGSSWSKSNTRLPFRPKPKSQNIMDISLPENEASMPQPKNKKGDEFKFQNSQASRSDQKIEDIVEESLPGKSKNSWESQDKAVETNFREVEVLNPLTSQKEPSGIEQEELDSFMENEVRGNLRNMIERVQSEVGASTSGQEPEENISKGRTFKQSLQKQKKKVQNIDSGAIQGFKSNTSDSLFSEGSQSKGKESPKFSDFQQAFKSQSMQSSSKSKQGPFESRNSTQKQNQLYGMSLTERLEAQQREKLRESGGNLGNEPNIETIQGKSLSETKTASNPSNYAFARKNQPPSSGLDKWKKTPISKSKYMPSQEGPKIGRWNSSSQPKKSSLNGNSVNKFDRASDTKERALKTPYNPQDLPPDSPIGLSPNLRNLKDPKPEFNSQPDGRDTYVTNKRPEMSIGESLQNSFGKSEIRKDLSTPVTSRNEVKDFTNNKLENIEGKQNVDDLTRFERESEEMAQELEEGVPGATSIFGKNILTHEAADEQRRLREEAKEEMERRAKLARNEGNNRAYEDAMNMIDAIAAGEDLNTMLKIGGKKEMGIKETIDKTQKENRMKMEQVLNQLRAGASSLPEEERKDLNKKLKVLESDKENISQVLSQLGAGLDSIPSDDKADIQDQLKKEAWDPTRDAIGAALACGITSEELKQMVIEAEENTKAGRGGWYPSVAQASPKDMQQFKGF